MTSSYAAQPAMSVADPAAASTRVFLTAQWRDLAMFNYVVDPPVPANGPGIREIAVTEQTLHPGGPWAMRVTTTSDVTVVNNPAT